MNNNDLKPIKNISMPKNLYKKYFIKIGTTKFIKISLVLFLLNYFNNPFRIIAIAIHIGIALFHFAWHIAINSAIEKRKGREWDRRRVIGIREQYREIERVTYL